MPRLPDLEIITEPADRPERGRPPLLLVHGAWSTPWLWQRFWMPYLAAAGYDVHAVGLRGHGRSPAYRHLNRLRLRHYVDDVITAITTLDRPPVVIGHSMGGGVVQHLLARRDRPLLAGAVLAASVPPAGALGATLAVARRDPKTFALANLTFNLGLLVEEPAMVRWLLFSDDAPEELVAETALHLQGESYLAFLDMLALDRPPVAQVEEPLLVLGAADDVLFTPAQAQGIGRAWRAPVVMLPDTAHGVMVDTRWKAAADAVLDWLDR